MPFKRPIEGQKYKERPQHTDLPHAQFTGTQGLISHSQGEAGGDTRGQELMAAMRKDRAGVVRKTEGTDAKNRVRTEKTERMESDMVPIRGEDRANRARENRKDNSGSVRTTLGAAEKVSQAKIEIRRSKNSVRAAQVP